jgi:hypothetical protein
VITSFGTGWDRTGTRALIEAIHDTTAPNDTSPGFRGLFVLTDGRLGPQIATRAYSVAW